VSDAFTKPGPPTNGDAGLPTVPFVCQPAIEGNPQLSIPEPSIWAMLPAGFAGLGLAALRRAKSGGAVN